MAEKLALLEAAKEPGETISSVGRRSGVAASLLFRWKRELTPNGTPTATTSPMRRLRERLAAVEDLLAAAKLENRLLRSAVEQLVLWGNQADVEHLPAL